MISMHPEVEAKVLAELDAHGLLVTAARPTPRQLDWEDLRKLAYTNQCIKACREPRPSPRCRFAMHARHGRTRACCKGL